MVDLKDNDIQVEGHDDDGNIIVVIGGEVNGREVTEELHVHPEVIHDFIVDAEKALNQVLRRFQ